jgi:CBS domain-containing protein
VIDFVPGKQAWFEENEPREGASTEETWLGDAVNSDVPTCSPDDRVGEVRKRLESTDWKFCPVVNRENILLGVLSASVLAGNPDARAGDVMKSAMTYRPNLTLEQLLDDLRKRDFQGEALVTTLEGRLLGTISRADLETTIAHEQG